MEAGAAMYDSVPASCSRHQLEHLFGSGDDIVLDSLVQGGEEGAIACHAYDHPLVVIRVLLGVEKCVSADHVVLDVGTATVKESFGHPHQVLDTTVILKGAWMKLHVEQRSVGSDDVVETGNRLD